MSWAFYAGVRLSTTLKLRLHALSASLPVWVLELVSSFSWRRFTVIEDLSKSNSGLQSTAYLFYQIFLLAAGGGLSSCRQLSPRSRSHVKQSKNGLGGIGDTGCQQEKVETHE